MKEVVCYCCEMFKPLDKLIVYKKDLVNGICMHTNNLCSTESPVCQDFILRKGLFTKRTIPDRCVNYKSKNYKETKIYINDLLK